MKHETLLSLPLFFIHLSLIDTCSVSWIILPETQTKFLPPSQNYKTNPVRCLADCQKLHQNEFTTVDKTHTHMLCRSVTSLTHEAWPQFVNLIDNSTKQSLSHFVWDGEDRRKSEQLLNISWGETWCGATTTPAKHSLHLVLPWKL